MVKRKIEVEKRKDLRVETAEPITLKFRVKTQKGIFRFCRKKTARSRNLSVGGMRIELPLIEREEIENIIEGKKKLILELDIPHLKKPLKITGKLVWLEKRDMRGKNAYVTGVSFEGLSEKDREKILNQLINICIKNGCNIN